MLNVCNTVIYKNVCLVIQMTKNISLIYICSSSIIPGSSQFFLEKFFSKSSFEPNWPHMPGSKIPNALENLLFNSSGYISRSGIAGWQGDSMFNLLRNCQTVFHSNRTIFHSYQQCTRVLVSPHPCRHLLFSFEFFFLILPVYWVQSSIILWFWFAFI